MRSPITSRYCQKAIKLLMVFTFTLTGFNVPLAQAEQGFSLPPVGARLALTPAFEPALLKGIKVYPDNPLRFDFLMTPSGDETNQEELKAYGERMVRYFLAALTVPEEDLWVNLSPYEKNRIVPMAFGQTEMGRDLLAEDYLLKQLSASLMDPDSVVGAEFWAKVYAQAQERLGTTDIPVDTFHKVWIVPQTALVYENAANASAYVQEARLKVMIETDYLAYRQAGLAMTQRGEVSNADNPLKAKQDEIVRQIIIPLLEKEVNEGAHFAQTRAIYYTLILANWYKDKIKESLLSKAYVNKSKTKGIQLGQDIESSLSVEQVYQQYVEAFKKGVANVIKEEIDPLTDEVIARKYFVGGQNFGGAAALAQVKPAPSGLFEGLKRGAQTFVLAVTLGLSSLGASAQGVDKGEVFKEDQAGAYVESGSNAPKVVVTEANFTQLISEPGSFNAWVALRHADRLNLTDDQLNLLRQIFISGDHELRDLVLTVLISKSPRHAFVPFLYNLARSGGVDNVLWYSYLKGFSEFYFDIGLVSIPKPDQWRALIRAQDRVELLDALKALSNRKKDQRVLTYMLEIAKVMISSATADELAKDKSLQGLARMLGDMRKPPQENKEADKLLRLLDTIMGVNELLRNPDSEVRRNILVQVRDRELYKLGEVLRLVEIAVGDANQGVREIAKQIINAAKEQKTNVSSKGKFIERKENIEIVTDPADFILVSDAHTMMEQVIMFLPNLEGYEMQSNPIQILADFIKTFPKQTKILIAVDNVGLADELMRYLVKNNIATDQINFLLSPGVEGWPRDPLSVLVNERTGRWSVLKNQREGNRDGEVARSLMSANIPELVMNNFPSPFREGAIVVDDDYVFVPGEASAEQITKYTGKKLMAFPELGNNDHIDLVIAAVGETRLGDHTILVADPQMALDMLTKLTGQERQEAIKAFRDSLGVHDFENSGIEGFLREINGNNQDVFVGEALKKLMDTYNKIAKRLEAAGFPVVRVPTIPRGSLKDNLFAFYGANILQAVVEEGGQLKRYAWIPTTGIKSFDNWFLQIIRSLEIYDKINPVLLNGPAVKSAAGPHCLGYFIGKPKILLFPPNQNRKKGPQKRNRIKVSYGSEEQGLTQEVAQRVEQYNASEPDDASLDQAIMDIAALLAQSDGQRYFVNAKGIFQEAQSQGRFAWQKVQFEKLVETLQGNDHRSIAEQANDFLKSIQAVNDVRDYPKDDLVNLVNRVEPNLMPLYDRIKAYQKDAILTDIQAMTPTEALQIVRDVLKIKEGGVFQSIPLEEVFRSVVFYDVVNSRVNIVDFVMNGLSSGGAETLRADIGENFLKGTKELYAFVYLRQWLRDGGSLDNLTAVQGENPGGMDFRRSLLPLQTKAGTAGKINFNNQFIDPALIAGIFPSKVELIPNADAAVFMGLNN